MIQSWAKLRFGRVPSDLSALVERCRQGDREAWDSLVDSLSGLVYSIPQRIGLPADDCADVFQATFLALFRNLDKIQSGQALPKWVSVTAARESMRVRRISGRNVQAGADGEPDLEAILRTEDEEVEQRAVAADEAHRVRIGLEKMGGECRKLLDALFTDEETPYAEISQRLGIPVGAIGPKRARCLQRLRKILVEAGLFEK